MEQPKSPTSPTHKNLAEDKRGSLSPKKFPNKLQRMFSLQKYPSTPASPSTPESTDGFFQSSSYESILKQDGQTCTHAKEKNKEKKLKRDKSLEIGIAEYTLLTYFRFYSCAFAEAVRSGKCKIIVVNEVNTSK
ncbi:hypothetical protein Trydic_g13831 [Trypoxylus dichotomus]